jgi:hypothetical protein
MIYFNNIINKKLFFIYATILVVFFFNPLVSHGATLLSDDFTGTTIDTTKWQEIDTGGLGGTVGNIQQNGTLTTANGYVLATWGTNALISVDTFDSNGLEISAVMTRNSDQLLGYGDYNFQTAGTKAYILDLVSGSLLTLVWNNGLLSSNIACGTYTAGATYKMSITSKLVLKYTRMMFGCVLTILLFLLMTKKYFYNLQLPPAFLMMY